MDSTTPPTVQDNYLVYRDGDGRQHIVNLSSGQPKLTVGRSANSDIVLGWDAEVSRLHAQLERVAADWVLVDDGISRNGTFVNGERLSGRASTKRRRHPADRIDIVALQMRTGHRLETDPDR